MKHENVLSALVIVPFFGFAFWMAIHSTKSFYDWHVWYSSGAEPIVVEGTIVAISPPGRKGPNQHKIVLKKDNGDKVILRSKLPNGLYHSLRNGVEQRRGGRRSAIFTIGLGGDNEMFKLSSGNNVFFEKPTNYGNRPEQIIVAIAMCLMWVGMAAIFLRMIYKELTNKEQN